MKRIFSNVMLLAVAATAFFSCQKPEVIVPETSQEVTLTFSSEKPAFDDETKTEWNGETIQWSEGDKIAIAYTCNEKWMGQKNEETQELSAPKLYKSDPLAIETETAKFNVSASFNIQNEGTHVFYGVYPAPSSTSFADAPIASLTVPALQTPKANSFDGAADLMTGVSVDAFNSLDEAKAENISMKWTRLVAHANITLKALNGVTAGEKVTSISLTAQEGANLVGQQKVNLLTNEVVNNNDASNVLELNGGNLSIDENGNVEFWACVLPETLTSLTVVVETDKATYTREITGISTTFMQNARNTLSVKMNAATRVEKDIVSWVLVTPVDGLTEGTYALVASTSTKTGALVSSKGSSSALTFETSVSVEENILHGVTAVMQFDITGSAENWVLSVAGDATKWLYCTDTNNGVRVGNNDNKTWTISKHKANADAFAFKHISTNRYLGVYNNSDWRCYTAVDAANFTSVTGSSQIYLYKKTSGAVAPDTTPKLVVAEESLSLTAAAAEGTIAVTAKNVSDISVTALDEKGSQDEVDWLTVEYANGDITYTAAANESEDERTAYIEVYALDLESNELVAGVNVTQAGKVVVDPNFEAGDYWIIGVEDGTSHVMLPLASNETYGYPSSEVIADNRTFAKYAFTFEAVEGGFNIKASDDRYYSTKENYKSFQITEDTPSVWTVSAQNDGTYLITDASTGKTIKYGDGTYTTFGVYGESDDNTGVYPILVKADNPLSVELSSISVSGQKTSFTVGDAFEFGGTVTATYNDGSTETVTPTSVSTPDMTEGNHDVTVTYVENDVSKSVVYTITVKAAGGNEGEDIVEGDSYTYTFTAKQFSANGDVTLGNLTWSLVGDGGYWGYESTKGQQLGSESKPYKSMTFSTSGYEGGVKRIVINTSGASSINATFTVTVNGVQYGASTKLTTSATEYTFEVDDADMQAGDIVFTYTQTSSKAIYIKSIAIN